MLFKIDIMVKWWFLCSC